MSDGMNDGISDETDLKKRKIRSFVVRSGRMTLGQKKGWDDYWGEYGLEMSDEALDFNVVFGNDHPVVLEIGFGMGASLFEMARAQPELNFIGIEVHRPGVGALLAMAGDAELNNLKLYCCDANEVINKGLLDNSLHRVQLFFPDPWHKNRHHKRRLVQTEFVQRITRKLAIGGVFHLATDWEHYARHMMTVLSAIENLDNLAGVGHYSDKPVYRPSTKFENRGINLGHGVWDLLFGRSQ